MSTDVLTDRAMSTDVLAVQLIELMCPVTLPRNVGDKVGKYRGVPVSAGQRQPDRVEYSCKGRFSLSLAKQRSAAKQTDN